MNLFMVIWMFNICFNDGNWFYGVCIIMGLNEFMGGDCYY